MPERMELSHKEKQKKRLIVAAVVLVIIIIGFVARHFVGDWLRNRTSEPKRDMAVATTDVNGVSHPGELSQHDLKKLGKKMIPQVAEEMALANGVPSDKAAASPAVEAKPADAAQKPAEGSAAGSEPAPASIPAEKTPMQNAMETLTKRLEVDAFVIPVAGRRLALFRYRYPAVRVDTVSHGMLIYGYAGNQLKRVACYYRYPVSLTKGACADEIEKVFHVRI